MTNWHALGLGERVLISYTSKIKNIFGKITGICPDLGLFNSVHSSDS